MLKELFIEKFSFCNICFAAYVITRDQNSNAINYQLLALHIATDVHIYQKLS